jgi:GMP synthase (glutamine-hydrolysing)
MEHERAVQQGAPCRDAGSDGPALHHAYCADVRRRLEEASDDRCVVRRYSAVTQTWLDAAGVTALVLSGNVTEWNAYDEAQLQPLQEIVRRASVPILGLCGGLQLIALAHGADVGPIRKLETGEEDVDEGYASGYLKEWGFTPLQIKQPDPLFTGLEAPVFLEAHWWEVRNVPPGFELLASTDTCRVQVLRQTGTLVYGTQFHPEAYITRPADRRNCLIERVYPAGYRREQPDGYRMLVNFFREAAEMEEL